MTAKRSVDFEAEGLLEGIDGEDARAARLDLLERLHSDGVSLDELREAVQEDRLALLPVDRLLGGEPKHTLDGIAEEAGLDPDFLRAALRGLGMPQPPAGERAFDDSDLEAARRLRAARDAGLPEEAQIEVARVVGQSMARVADAVRLAVAEAFIRPGDNERDLGFRYADAARALIPILTSSLDHALTVHLREGVRSDVMSGVEIATGRIEGASEIAVCFADLVGFTRLGEHVAPDELSGVASRLGDIAAELAEPPVRLIKLIGDAAMLVSQEPDPLVETALDLVAAAEKEGDRFPDLRAGVALGPALSRGGDWYGRPVNIASRVTEIARPGSVLATKELRDAVADDGFKWSRARRRRVKGVKEPMSLYRVRRNGAGA